MSGECCVCDVELEDEGWENGAGGRFCQVCWESFTAGTWWDMIKVLYFPPEEEKR